MQKEHLYYPSADGQHTIHAILWQPEDPKAVVQIVHGIAEHAGRYENYAQYLCSRGFAVAAEDHLGHGASAAAPDGSDACFFAEKNGWQTVCTDILALTKTVKARFAGLPYFLLGHSMGSFLSRTIMLQHSREFTGLLLSGTGHQNGVTLFFGGLLARLICLFCGPRKKSRLINTLAFAAYNKKFAPNRTDFDWVCSDPAEVDRYIADKQCGAMATAGLFLDMLHGLALIKSPKRLRQIRKDLPVYLYSGDRDPVGGMGKGVRKVAALYKAAGLTDVTLTLYKNGRHEMHNEPNKAQVMQAAADWMETRLQAAKMQ